MNMMNDEAQLSEIPIVRPPQGQKSNFVNPTNLEDATLATTVTVIVLASLGAIARFASIVLSKRRLWWDDAVCAIAIAFAFTYSGLTLAVNRTSRHSWDIPVSFLDANTLKEMYAGYITLTVALCASKFSILLLYFRVFSIKRPIRIAIFIAMALTFGLLVPNIAVHSYFSAPHIGESWSPQILETVPPVMRWFLAQSVLVLGLDIYIFIIPFFVISKLHLSRSRRWGLAAVFLVGLLAVVAAAISVWSRYEINVSTDEGWYGAIARITVTVEIYISIIVSCTPGAMTFIKLSLVQVGLASAQVSSEKTTQQNTTPATPRVVSSPSPAFKSWYSTSSNNSNFSTTGTQHTDLTAHIGRGAYLDLTGETGDLIAYAERGDERFDCPPGQIAYTFDFDRISRPRSRASYA